MIKTSTVVQVTLKRSSRKATSGAAWPTRAQWNGCRRVRATRLFSRLGIEPERADGSGLRASQALKVLGPDAFAKFSAVRAEGKVIWCNFDLARQLGFDVPPGNLLTPEFHNQLLSLSLRSVDPDENHAGKQTVSMYADRYGGDGLGPAMGAGRAGFLAHGNLYVKGIGFTPLFRHDDVDDFAHSHGGVHLDDCLVEAVFGEVNENLFDKGSSRIVAIIDQGKEVIAPTGQRIRIGIAVRTGAQLRPAHLLRRLRSKDSQLKNFVAITTASGQLATKQDRSTREDIPDLKATMLRIIDDHAQTAAEGFRWRMIHGALSASNMDISGAMLDLPTQSTQPRTAPVWLLDYSDSIFGSEHTARAVYLSPVYRKLLRNVPESDRKKFNLELLNIRGEMAQAYGKHLQVQLLRAAGFKTEVARRIQCEHIDLAGRFANLIIEMSSLKNRGALCVAKSVVEDIAVLDVFNLLGTIPEIYFTNPAADHRAFIYDQLKPILKGNRFHRARKRGVIETLVDKFAELYRELMGTCGEYATVFYDDLKRMQASISARAAFENAPLDHLYSHRLFTELRQAITIYKSTGNARILSDAIDQRIVASLRSVDGLLAQGSCSRLPGGGIQLERRTIDGVDYSVRAWNDAAQTRRLHVSLPVQRAGSCYSIDIWHPLQLTNQQIQSLRYRFTTDRWKTSATARARLKEAGRNGLTIEFEDLPSVPIIGQLEGTFYFHGSSELMPKDRNGASAYVFAIPDKQELLRLVTGSLSGLNHQESRGPILHPWVK
jgi:hypothetical protein